MIETKQPVKKIRMRCYECLNYLVANVYENGGVSGTCPVCKAKFFAKQHSGREKHIRIVKQS